jgi:hypothetical protein
VEDYHEEWKFGRVLVWDVARMAGLGVFIDSVEYRRRFHSDTYESLYSLE